MTKNKQRRLHRSHEGAGWGVGILKLKERIGQRRKERDHNGRALTREGSSAAAKNLENEGE